MTEENPTNDVIVEEQEVTQAEPNAESTDSVTVEETTEVVNEQPKDDYWKNRAFELDRKLNNLASDIPVIVEKTLAEKTQNTQEREYTVAELEAYAIEHPEHRPWVEEQKMKKLDERFEQKLKAQRELERTEQQKRQTEAQILADPRYAEAFVTDPSGMKVFNPQSELARLMHGYLNAPELKNRPDALAIAGKLARADLMDSSVQKKDQDLTSLKRQAAKLKQQTMAEGAGVNDPVPAKDNFQKAQERLAQTGRRDDAQQAVKEYFRKIRK